MFDLSGKVALVTGGASGIGLCCVKELLRNGIKGVAIADICSVNKRTVLEAIETEFGENRAIFISTDITDKHNFENAFRVTVEAFQNIDILINNAAVMNERNWEETVKVNVNGTINGCLLALENLSNYKSGKEGVVLNMSSIAAVQSYPVFPIYSATKHAILGLSKCLGLEAQYQHSHVRFLTLCPGGTDTPLMANCETRTLGPFYQSIIEKLLVGVRKQTPENVAKAVVEIIINGSNGSVWVVEGDKPVYEIEIPHLESMRKK